MIVNRQLFLEKEFHLPRHHHILPHHPPFIQDHQGVTTSTKVRLLLLHPLHRLSLPLRLLPHLYLPNQPDRNLLFIQGAHLALHHLQFLSINLLPKLPKVDHQTFSRQQRFSLCSPYLPNQVQRQFQSFTMSNTHSHLQPLSPFPSFIIINKFSLPRLPSLHNNQFLHNLPFSNTNFLGHQIFLIINKLIILTQENTNNLHHNHPHLYRMLPIPILRPLLPSHRPPFILQVSCITPYPTLRIAPFIRNKIESTLN